MRFQSILFCCALIFLVSCNCNKHIDERKILIKDNLWAEWYYISDITFDQEVVELVDTRSGGKQIVYKGGGICTLDAAGSNLTIFTDRGSYVLFRPDNKFNGNVLLDTTCTGSSLYKH